VQPVRLVTVNPRCTATLAHAKTRRVLALVRNDKQNILTIGVPKVLPRPLIPVELIAFSNLGELGRGSERDVLFSIALVERAPIFR
jgi:hypothetical protein